MSIEVDTPKKYWCKHKHEYEFKHMSTEVYTPTGAGAQKTRAGARALRAVPAVPARGRLACTQKHH